MTHEVIMDGQRIGDYSGFVSEFNRAFSTLWPGVTWDGEEFNDLDNILELPERYRIRWINSGASQEKLDHLLMAAFWRQTLLACREAFPFMTDIQQDYEGKIEMAEAKSGPTLFDFLVEQLTYPEYCDLILE